jgi:predicted Zn finger-like uncharacterized protein
MLIVCPSCATTFRVEKSVLGVSGRQVRCAQCRGVWMATPESAMEEPVAAEAAVAASAPPQTPPSPPAADDDADWGAAFAEEAKEKNKDAQDDDIWPDANELGDAKMAFADAPPIAPDSDVAPLPARPEDREEAEPEDERPARKDVETAVSRRRRPSGPRLARRPFQMSMPVAILLLGSAILGTFFLGREQVVRTIPDAASVYERLGLPVNLRGVEFRDVKGANEIVDGVVVLVVEGRLVNITGKAIDLPRLRLAVRDATGKEIYTWTATAPKAQLEPGEAAAFRSRLASPPPDGASVEVRFFSRVDAAGR